MRAGHYPKRATLPMAWAIGLCLWCNPLAAQQRLSKEDLGLPSDLGFEKGRPGGPFVLRGRNDLAYFVAPDLDSSQALRARLKSSGLLDAGVDEAELRQLVEGPMTVTPFYEMVDTLAKQFLDAVVGYNEVRSGRDLYSIVTDVRGPRLLLITFDAQPLKDPDTHQPACDFVVRMFRVLKSRDNDGNLTVIESCELCFEDRNRQPLPASGQPLLERMRVALQNALRDGIATSFCSAPKMRREEPIREREVLVGSSLANTLQETSP